METDTMGHRIKLIRDAMGLDQADIAEKFKVSRVTVSNWETNKKKPGLDKLIKFVDVGETTLDWIVLGRGQGPRKGGEVSASIDLRGEVARKRLVDQANRPTQKYIMLRTVVEWMDHQYKNNERQALHFYTDIRDMYPSFKEFTEKKQIGRDYNGGLPECNEANGK